MQRIIEVMEDFCQEREFDFRDDYSGRGMFGRKCVGIVIDSGTNSLEMIMELTEMLIDNDIEYVSEKIGAIRQDNMGMGTIIYFPRIKKEITEE